MTTAKQLRIASLDPFARAYVEAMLWSSTDGEDPLDDNYSVQDLADATLDTIIAHCEAFQSLPSVSHAIARGDDGQDFTRYERAGHDFWLTRAGHGAGFWDGDWSEPDGELLTDAAKSFGNLDPYVGDDGKLYFS